MSALTAQLQQINHPAIANVSDMVAARATTSEAWSSVHQTAAAATDPSTLTSAIDAVAVSALPIGRRWQLSDYLDEPQTAGHVTSTSPKIDELLYIADVRQ